MILCADVLEGLASLPDGLADCCVTSPPYWGLRSYGFDGQIGLESTPAEYVERLVSVFREMRRVLRADGTLWLNLGDCYANIGHAKGNPGNHGTIGRPRIADVGDVPQREKRGGDLKHKDLVGIPWMVAFALRADGWWLRSEIVWHKRSPMPESVTDRPTRAHEQVFLLAKARRYYFDADAVREPLAGNFPANHPRRVLSGPGPQALPPGQPPHTGIRRYGQDGKPTSRYNFARATKEADVPGASNRQHRLDREPTFATDGRNLRSVWTLGPEPFPEAHFATFPEALVEPCIKAGSRVGGIVIDPFGGSGTTGRVARRLNRRFVLIDRNPAYCAMARRRTSMVQRELVATEPASEPAPAEAAS